MALKGSKTEENLKAAAGESQANRRYFTSLENDVEGYNDVASVLINSKGETGHAHGHLDT